MTFSQDDTRRFIEAVAGTLIDHAEELSDLDSAIGDGDHGNNMRRGMTSVLEILDGLVAKPLPTAVKDAGMQLVMKVGGASGPLYGTLFMTLGKELPEDASRDDVARAFRAAIDAVKARGKSDFGQKTMLDVLGPVADALEAGKTPSEISAVAAEARARTRDMLALKGRASFLGERSLGHVDPGARSSELIVKALSECAGEE